MIQWYIMFAEKHSHKNLRKINIIIKLETIVILYTNIEMQYIKYVM